MADGARRLAVTAHPAVVGALAVLVANDHALKGWSGGVDGGGGVLARAVTGKASDVAGVLLLAVVLGALTGRRRAAVVAVGVGFAALKLSPAVADLAIPVLGGRTRTDPWDLLALVALVPAHRLLGPVARPAPPAARRVPLRAGAGLAVLVASVPAMTATSEVDCSSERSAVVVLAPVGEAVLAGLGTPRQLERFEEDLSTTSTTTTTTTGPSLRTPAVPSGLDWVVSHDGTRTWEDTPEPVEADVIVRSARATEGCTATTCYRSTPAAVEERPVSGGDWERSFALTDDQVDAASGTCGMATTDFGDLVVAGDVVLVANGSEGAVRRIGDGPWLRTEVGGIGPSRVDPDGDEDDEDSAGEILREALGPLYPATAILVGLFLVLGVAALFVPRRRLGWSVMIAGFGLLGLWALAIVFVYRRGDRGPGDGAWIWFALAAVVAATLVPPLRKPRPVPPPVPPPSWPPPPVAPSTGPPPPGRAPLAGPPPWTEPHPGARREPPRPPGPPPPSTPDPSPWARPD